MFVTVCPAGEQPNRCRMPVKCRDSGGHQGLRLTLLGKRVSHVFLVKRCGLYISIPSPPTNTQANSKHEDKAMLWPSDFSAQSTPIISSISAIILTTCEDRSMQASLTRTAIIITIVIIVIVIAGAIKPSESEYWLPQPAFQICSG